MATDTADLPRYYSATQVAKALRFSKEKTLRLIREGRIRAIVEGHTFRVSAEAVRDFEHSGLKPATGQEPNGQDPRDGQTA
jgi:excisionase family DNA binding protein